MLKFFNSLEEIKFSDGLNIFIVDRRLKSAINGLKSKGYIYQVKAGEDLKSLESFQQHITKILHLTEGVGRRRITLVAIGGGSVGDFSGFVASVLKRGVRLIHIPSTWLAAIDSSHGGKTALNVGAMKNQVGTFYHAESTYLVRDLLFSQPKERAREAAGELIKIALIKGGRLWMHARPLSKWSHQELWTLLPAAIKAKLEIVKRDPDEAKGVRHLLNLGHTMGHVFELVHHLPHGRAVLFGLEFALFYSREKGFLSEKKYDELRSCPAFYMHPKVELVALPVVKGLIKHDKKVESSGNISFVFTSGPGKVFIKAVPLRELYGVYKNFEHFYVRS